MKDQDRFEILLEDINSKFDYVVEAVSDTNERLGRIESELAKKANKKDIETITKVVKDNSVDTNDHERRITYLEKQVA